MQVSKFQLVSVAKQACLSLTEDMFPCDNAELLEGYVKVSVFIMIYIAYVAFIVLWATYCFMRSEKSY